jgi:hypothetical protein
MRGALSCCSTRLKQLAVWAVLAIAVATVHAQTFDLANGRQTIASLDGRWRFHPGDDIRWAQPGFDDSHWPLLDSTRSWYEQGYPGLSGWAWYRFAVVLPAGSESLELRLPMIFTAYEAYADGQKIGACGNPRPGAFVVAMRRCAFRLPAEDRLHPHWMHVALRVWHEPLWSSFAPGGSTSAGALIGNAGLVAEKVKFGALEQTTENTDLLFDAVLRAIIGAVVLGLFLLRRGEREYLWFALIQIFGGADDSLEFFHGVYGIVTVQLNDLIDAAFAAGFWIAGFFFIATILKARRGFWFRLSVVLVLLSPLAETLYWPGWIPVPVAGLLSTSLVLPSQVWILAMLFARARRRDPDAMLLLGPVLLVNGFYVAANVLSALSQFGVMHGLIDVFNFRFQIEPFPIGLYTLFNIIYSVALLGFLIRRMSLSRRKEELLEGQLEAARQVQQHLVPASVPDIAGLSIGVAYEPASEVGGDFYQVLTQLDGSALIVVGDVSGKGLKAAMNGVLAIGALRTLAAEQLSPGPLLERLNAEIAGSQDGGFITCLCVRIAPGGAATLANAGHLAPFHNGEEVAVESGLPLGLLAPVEYAETRLQLLPGELLTLLSDGVVEARNAAGELYGFDRTQAISKQPAKAIAEAAMEFGQEDDITVLSVARIVGLTPELASLSAVR